MITESLRTILKNEAEQNVLANRDEYIKDEYIRLLERRVNPIDPQSLADELVMMNRQRIINAIKIVRMVCGGGLKECKDIVDEAARRYDARGF